MKSNRKKRTQPLASYNYQKKTKYSSNWVRRGLALATALEQFNTPEKIENLSSEDMLLQNLTFKQDNRGSVGENRLYQIVCQIFSARLVLCHQRPAWLLGLELDIYLPTLNLAFEYQGQQHFNAIEPWGGEEALKGIKERDARKAHICNQVGVKLITVSYTEPLTEDYIRKVLAEQYVI